MFTVARLLERCDALRRPERFRLLLGVCEADFRGRLGFGERPYPQNTGCLSAAEAVRGIEAAAIAKACEDPARIPERLHEARVEAVKRLGLQQAHDQAGE